MHGLALCCGVSPTFKAFYPSEYSCLVCGKKVGGWSADQIWIASLWNQQANPTAWTADKKLIYGAATTLDVGWPWRYAKLHYTYHPAYGERSEVARDFILFAIEERPESEWVRNKEGWEYVIDESRCFKTVDCQRWDGTRFNLRAPNTKSTPAQIYVGRSWCTNDHWWYTLNVTTYNPKWDLIMRAVLNL